MKIQIDTTNKEIIIKDSVTLKDLKAFLDKLLTKEEQEEYTVKSDLQIVNNPNMFPYNDPHRIIGSQYPITITY